MNDGNENTRKYCFVSIAHKSQPKKTLFICHYRYDLSILPLNEAIECADKNRCENCFSFRFQEFKRELFYASSITFFYFIQ